MRERSAYRARGTTILAPALLMLLTHPAAGQLNLGPEEIVQAGGTDLIVPEYSVPSFVHWDGDNLPDLVVGEKSDTSTGKVRVYLNVGTPSAPQFTTHFYAQANGSDLVVTASGCLGCFPRVVYWDADDRKDLLIGESYGYITLFLNIGTDTDPTFDGGTRLQMGEAGAKTIIDVGSRATACIVDWDSDGRKDLVVGELMSKIHIFLNEGTDAAPDFRTRIYAQENGADLTVPGYRASPHVLDLNDDGKKDLLAGNTDGQLLFYANTGTDAAPVFSGYEFVTADGVPIDLSSTRSRPFICDWTGDGLLDVLVGASDGKVRLYQGLPEPVSSPADIDGDGDVDQEDFGHLQACFGQVTDGCEDADLDGDGDVDQDDFTDFQACMNGPNQPPPPGCGERE